jgi:hypothetical protein
MPAMPTAVRRRGSLRSTGWPWTSIERTRPRAPEGSSATSSPTSTRPDHAVPVTTVPTPAMENARSTGSRK